MTSSDPTVVIRPGDVGALSQAVTVLAEALSTSNSQIRQLTETVTALHERVAQLEGRV